MQRILVYGITILLFSGFLHAMRPEMPSLNILATQNIANKLPFKDLNSLITDPSFANKPIGFYLIFALSILYSTQAALTWQHRYALLTAIKNRFQEIYKNYIETDRQLHEMYSNLSLLTMLTSINMPIDPSDPNQPNPAINTVKEILKNRLQYSEWESTSFEITLSERPPSHIQEDIILIFTGHGFAPITQIGISLLDVAVAAHTFDLINVLLKLGAKERGSRICPLVTFAIYKHMNAVAEKLLDRGAPSENQENIIYDPLIVAAGTNNFEMTEFLKSLLNTSYKEIDGNVLNRREYLEHILYQMEEKRMPTDKYINFYNKALINLKEMGASSRFNPVEPEIEEQVV